MGIIRVMGLLPNVLVIIIQCEAPATIAFSWGELVTPISFFFMVLK